EEKRAELEPYKARLTMLQDAHKKVAEYLKQESFTKADLDKISSEAPAEVTKAKNIGYMLTAGGGAASDYLKDFEGYVNGQLDYNLNPDFKGRKTGDDIFDINDKIYGNSDVMGD